ncbi:hypothetical protein [Leptodesmis sichuanensis]|uniref:hypothetical protein n=1 Tax=Leptodesmis sichuanensis TaxID=2906798 RepID=UPI001F31F47A|nr:hypothetical protein [Leptodesmis sichuanensis]UIE38084.1 hypothetical protein KIK02_24845 [Leptodesmis sichuanensis A121]
MKRLKQRSSRHNKSLHRNAVCWSVELQRLSASGELGRYAASSYWLGVVAVFYLSMFSVDYRRVITEALIQDYRQELKHKDQLIVIALNVNVEPPVMSKWEYTELVFKADNHVKILNKKEFEQWFRRNARIGGFTDYPGDLGLTIRCSVSTFQQGDGTLSQLDHINAIKKGPSGEFIDSERNSVSGMYLADFIYLDVHFNKYINHYGEEGWEQG